MMPLQRKISPSMIFRYSGKSSNAATLASDSILRTGNEPLHAASDGRQRVVDLVSDAGRQLANARELFVGMGRFFKTAPICDVLSKCDDMATRHCLPSTSESCADGNSAFRLKTTMRSAFRRVGP